VSEWAEEEVEESVEEDYETDDADKEEDVGALKLPPI
jgi:hypothetical protein